MIKKKKKKENEKLHQIQIPLFGWQKRACYSSSLSVPSLVACDSAL